VFSTVQSGNDIARVCEHIHYLTMRAQLRAQWMFSVIITSTERSKSFENLHFQLNSVPQCAKWSWYLSSMRTTQLRAHKMFLVDNYIHWKVEVGRKSTFREQQCITYLFKMGIYTALATGLQLQAMSLHWPRCWLGTQHVARACAGVLRRWEVVHYAVLLCEELSRGLWWTFLSWLFLVQCASNHHSRNILL
jgi:hypothetical protein